MLSGKGFAGWFCPLFQPVISKIPSASLQFEVVNIN
jgi:hypothetical protein